LISWFIFLVDGNGVLENGREKLATAGKLLYMSVQIVTFLQK